MKLLILTVDVFGHQPVPYCSTDTNQSFRVIKTYLSLDARRFSERKRSWFWAKHSDPVLAKAIQQAHKTSSQAHLLYYTAEMFSLQCSSFANEHFLLTCFDSSLLLQTLIQSIWVVCHLALNKNGFGNTYYPCTHPSGPSSESTTQNKQPSNYLLSFGNLQSNLEALYTQK